MELRENWEKCCFIELELVRIDIFDYCGILEVFTPGHWPRVLPGRCRTWDELWMNLIFSRLWALLSWQFFEKVFGYCFNLIIKYIWKRTGIFKKGTVLQIPIWNIYFQSSTFCCDRTENFYSKNIYSFKFALLNAGIFFIKYIIHIIL